MPAGRYNLVVIGAGTAGLVTAAGAAGLGAKVRWSSGVSYQLGHGKIAATIHPYPTRAEAIRKVADQYHRTRLTPRAPGPRSRPRNNGARERLSSSAATARNSPPRTSTTLFHAYTITTSCSAP